MNEVMVFEKINRKLDINKLIDRIQPNSNDILFVAGSLIEGEMSKHSSGMGNINSDIDIFIITDDMEYYNDVVYDEGFCKTTFFGLDGNSFDVEIYEYKEVIYFIEKLRKIDFEDKDIDNICTLNLFDLNYSMLNQYMSFIHRIINSKPIYNCDKYYNIREQICEKNYYLYNVRYNINQVDLYYEDIVGYIEEKQGILAVCLARKLMFYAIGAFLFANNISFDREKWIPLLLENLSKENEKLKEIFESFKQLSFGVDLKNNSDYINNAKEILNWIDCLISNL